MAGIFAWMRGSGGVTYAWAAGTLYGISRPDRSERRKDWTVTRPTWTAPCRYLGAMNRTQCKTHGGVRGSHENGSGGCEWVPVPDLTEQEWEIIEAIRLRD